MRQCWRLLAGLLVVAAGTAVAENEHKYPRQPVMVTPETFLPTVERLRAGDGRLPRGTHLVLEPGHYWLEAEAYVDSSCGNCEDPETAVQATVGLMLAGEGIRLEGRGETAEEVVIHTRAGYGLLFRDCEDCELRRVTVTDGIRDADGNASDAAVVVQRSQVSIAGCLLADNLGDSTAVASTVVGIMGIAGREGAVLNIHGNRIIRNSWDGIALYRGAYANITDNVIDGVDKATGARTGGGRGVGIGVTWDARARIEGNLVTRYWKGIGVFVDAEAVIVGNVIEEMVTWGIAYWDAGRGRPVARISKNVVYDCGACGISILREASGEPVAGYCRKNIVARTGQNPKYDDSEYYCRQCPIAVHSQPEDFVIEDNLLYDNRKAPADTTGESASGAVEAGGSDLTESELAEAVGHRLVRMGVSGVFADARSIRELPGGISPSARIHD